MPNEPDLTMPREQPPAIPRCGAVPRCPDASAEGLPGQLAVHHSPKSMLQTGWQAVSTDPLANTHAVQCNARTQVNNSHPLRLTVLVLGHLKIPPGLGVNAVWCVPGS